MAYVDTYYVTAKGGTEPAEKVVAQRMAAGEHVHTWSVETGTLCMEKRPECERKKEKSDAETQDNRVAAAHMAEQPRANARGTDPHPNGDPTLGG